MRATHLKATEFTAERPWRVRLARSFRVPASLPYVLLLAALGLMIHSRWLTISSLAAGDWSVATPDQLRAWFPWPTVWEPSTGFGLRNFAGIYEFPLLAIAGLLGKLGVGWPIAEKLLYFWPFAVLSLITPWVLAREILGSPRWALLSALIFAGNSYFLIDPAIGHLFIAMAEALAPLVLFAFVRAMKRKSFRWALMAGLLFAIQAAYEVRITYLTVLMCLLYVAVVLVAEPSAHQLWTRLALTTATLGVLGGSQAYWLVPLLSYQGDYGLPIAASPWLAFMRITHGITAVHPFWTGGSPTAFRTAPLNPVFFALPLLAFVSLARRHLRPELIWLCLAALVAAFLIKQDNPPAGQIYDWMFFHFPGWSLFREASKLYFIVVIAYSVLVPYTIRWLIQVSGGARLLALRASTSIVAMLAVVGPLVVSFIPLEAGELDYTTRPIAAPASFRELSDILNSDADQGSVLWLGGASVSRSVPAVVHRFPLKSDRHPLLELSGNLDPGDDPNPSASDPLSRFCRMPSLPFCYLDDQLFPYLLRRTGAAYVVAPAGAGVGTLPTLPWSTQPAVSYRSLLDRLSSLLGQPRLLGSGTEALAVWSLQHEAAAAVAAPAVALVAGPTEVTQDVLPALKALEIPAVYRWNEIGPVSPSGLPFSVDIVPRTANAGNAYAVKSPADFGVLAATTQPALAISDGGPGIALRRIMSLPRLAGWAVYGPLALSRGMHPIKSPDTLGPLVSWSSLTEAVLSGQKSTKLLSNVSLEPERVRTQEALHGMPWLELQRSYDPGWRLDLESTHLMGDGLFNLYLATATALSPTFSFSTLGWEHLGLVLTTAWLLVVLAVLFRLQRSGNDAGLEQVVEPRVTFLNATARYLSLSGLVLLGLAAALHAVAWFGLPSKAPRLVHWLGTTSNRDPFSASESYVALAMLALALAAVLHLADRFALSLRWPRLKWPPVLLGGSLLILSSCSTTPNQVNIQSLIQSAQNASGTADCISAYTRVLEARSDLVSAYVGRGDCYMDNDNAVAAVHDYAQAIGMQPDNADLYVDRGEALQEAGDFHAAEADFMRAGHFTTASARQVLTAAEGLGEIGLYTEALRLVDSGLDRFPDFWELHKYRADLQLALGSEAVAFKEFDTAMRLAMTDGDRAWILEDRAGYYLARQRYDLAEADYGLAIRLVSDNYHLFYGRAKARLALGDRSGAEQDFDSAIESYAMRRPVNSLQLVQLFEERGRLYLGEDEPTKAVADFRSGLAALSSSDPRAWQVRLQREIARAGGL